MQAIELVTQENEHQPLVKDNYLEHQYRGSNTEKVVNAVVV